MRMDGHPYKKRRAYGSGRYTGLNGVPTNPSRRGERQKLGLRVKHCQPTQGTAVAFRGILGAPYQEPQRPQKVVSNKNVPDGTDQPFSEFSLVVKHEKSLDPIGRNLSVH